MFLPFGDPCSINHHSTGKAIYHIHRRMLRIQGKLAYFMLMIDNLRTGTDKDFCIVRSTHIPDLFG